MVSTPPSSCGGRRGGTSPTGARRVCSSSNPVSTDGAAAEEEADYVAAAMSFYQSNRYFSIYGLHYLVGYGAGAPALEAWAVAHPLRVIGQVYLDSPGLPGDYLNAYAGLEFDGTTDATYTTVVFPDGFDLIRYDETVLPTWFINPDERSSGASVAYWKHANDTTEPAPRIGRWARSSSSGPGPTAG